MKFSPQTDENHPEKVPPTIKIGQQKCAKLSVTQPLIILLKFCAEFEYVTPEVL